MGSSIRSTIEHADGPFCSVNSVAFNHDGSLLASASDDKTVRLWDPSSGQQLNMLTGHSGWVPSVAFNHDGSLLASGSNENTVRLWNPSSGQQLNTLTSHSGFPTSLAFNHDGSLLASGSYDGTVQLWQSDHQKVLTYLQQKIDSTQHICIVYHILSCAQQNKKIAPDIAEDYQLVLKVIHKTSSQTAEFLNRVLTEIAQPN